MVWIYFVANYISNYALIYVCEFPLIGYLHQANYHPILTHLLNSLEYHSCLVKHCSNMDYFRYSRAWYSDSGANYYKITITWPWSSGPWGRVFVMIDVSMGILLIELFDFGKQPFGIIITLWIRLFYKIKFTDLQEEVCILVDTTWVQLLKLNFFKLKWYVLQI